MKYRPLLHIGIVAIEKGAFGSHLTTVAKFTLLADVDFLCKMKSAYVLQKYHRELTIRTEQGKYIPLNVITQYKHWKWFSLNI